MRLKLDENLPHDLAESLRDHGHDIHTVIEEQLAGQPDPVVVTAASDEGRMLLTLDRGIGDVRRYPPGSHAGIVAIRPATQDPPTVIALVRLFPAADGLDDLYDCVTIVEPERIRIRRARSSQG